MTNLFATFIRRVGYVIATVIILAALLVSVGRLLTPVLNEHLPDFEAWSSDLLQTPVKIGNVKISWDLYEPVIAFDNVTILDKQTQHPQFAIHRITVNLNFFRSLAAWKPLPQSIKVSGVHLTIEKSKAELNLKELKTLTQHFSIEELKTLAVTDLTTGEPTNLDNVFGWIFSQPNLALEDVDITYHSIEGQEKSINITKLLLKNVTTQHQLLGHIIFNEEVPMNVDVNLNWVGNIMDFEHAAAHLYLYLEGISLPQWLEAFSWNHLKIEQGLGSAKVWITWDKNQFQKIQSQFQFYDLKIVSELTHKTQLFPRVSGHMGWRVEGNKQILAGNDILIDLSKHLWPATHFLITIAPTPANPFAVESLRVGYIDLADLKHMAFATGILSNEMQEKIAKWNPKGELRDLKIELPSGTTFADFMQVKLDAQFSRLSFDSWQSLPGVSNASGTINWSANQGNLTLNSNHVSLLYSPLISKPMLFEHLSGLLHWEKQRNGSWLLKAKKVNAANFDIDAQADGTMIFPLKESPNVDLSAQYTIKKAVHITDYVPFKILDKELAQWLTSAFLSGRVESGKAVIKGRFADFPFNKHKGTFFAGGIVKNMDLKYAPEWPVLHIQQGVLTFSGRKMTVDVNTGKMLDIPLHSIHTEIPYIGNLSPQILQVKGLIQADLSQGLHFIQKSPLHKTLGRDLGELKLTGPMKLNLGLTIPLKHPKETNVNCDLAFNNANLNLPLWNLDIDNLEGALYFTEQEIESSNLQGKLFNEPATLNFSTQRENGKVAYVKADLQSKITIPALQAWLKIPLKQYATGEAQYAVELRLAPHDQPQPTQLFVTTDLKGIAIQLPGPYGKTANEGRDFKVNIISGPNKQTQTKMIYDKLLSAAINLDSSKKELKFVGGELVLGEREAIWQTKPGLLITALFKHFDWDLVQPYYNWFNQISKSTPSKSFAQSSWLEQFRGLDLKADTANLLGQNLSNLSAQLSKTNKNWLINFNSAQIAGQVKVLNDFSQTQANLQKFYVTSSSDNNQIKIDPKLLPALAITANDVRFEDKSVGRLVLNTSPDKYGLQINQLRIYSPVANLNATGSWQMQSNSYKSRLKGTLITDRLNQMLNQWGVGASSLICSYANGQFDLNWPDAPYKPSLGDLSGNLTLRLGQGRVVNLSGSTEAKMGLGRMLSIFSLQTIPRRLSLDFSDLFQNGYSFDSMQGSFKLQDGNAVTNNTRFDGPVARIDIAGRIGFKAKNYNLKLGVTTNVATGSVLPAAIAATALNPIAGVATWVVGTMVTATSGAGIYQYQITGPWSDPIWQKVGSNSR